HVGNQPTVCETVAGAVGDHFLQQGKPSGRVEISACEICILPIAPLQLMGPAHSRSVDSDGNQFLQVVVLPGGTHPGHSPFATVETFLNKWQQYSILFFTAVEKGTNMRAVDQHGSGEPDLTTRIRRVVWNRNMHVMIVRNSY